MRSDQVVQSFIQSGLEKFQGWRLHSPSGPLLQSLIARRVVTFFLLSHLNNSISTSAWSKTGHSIPGSHEWHVTGNTTFPWSASWVPPDTAQHAASLQGTWRGYDSILWYRLSYRRSRRHRPPKAALTLPSIVQNPHFLSIWKSEPRVSHQITIN